MIHWSWLHLVDVDVEPHDNRAGGRNGVGPCDSIRCEKRGDLYFTKEMLLAVGDRYEKEIAAAREADARYR